MCLTVYGVAHGHPNAKRTASMRTSDRGRVGLAYSPVKPSFPVTVCVALFVVVGGSDARAQVSALGKGFLVDGAGSLTSDANEVISGRNSIKGSYSGAGSFTQFLMTDPTFIRFARSQTYTITLRYRVLAQGTRGFEFGFFSNAGSREGRFVRSEFFGGATGTSGTATLTARLEAYDDYTAGFKIEGTGVVAIDDIRITDGAAQLVVSENAEGPTIVPGPLNLQLTDATALRFRELAAFLVSATAKDLDGDGYPEAVLTLADTHNDSTTPIPVVVIQANGQMRIATSDFFPAGIPTVKDSPMTVFADLNGDGLQDIIFSEAGGDPHGAGRISVALNQGGGKYRDVSSLIPADQQNTRSYAIVVGDVLSDGRVVILLPDENDGANTVLLRWNGSGFDQIRNWVPQNIWLGGFRLHQQSWMNLADLDNDGKQDLLVSGQQNAPNIRLAFGASGGFSTAGVVIPPDGPWGHFDPGARPPAAQGAEVQPIVVADFNNDGLPDIFAAERKVVEYQPSAFTDTTDPNYANLHANGGTVYSDDSFQVLMNQGSRRFVDVTAPNYVNFGSRTFFSLLPIDINNDGFLDIVGGYQASLTIFKSVWGTTFFLNDGTGRFQPVDGSQLLGVTTSPSNGQVWNLGSFVPTLVTPQRIEGIVAETVGINCGACTGLNIYKVVGNGSLGTGPNFADPTKFGVAGFNEFFYLNQHPDVAAAVQRGEYKSGLDHYLVEGRAKGYGMHAPNPRVRR
jgi:FG-GAP-like repeat